MNDSAVAPPIPASTVLVLRDHDAGPQVLLLRRSPESSFAAHAYVFPGGAVDSADSDELLLRYAPQFDAAEAARRIGIDGEDAAAVSAAFHVAAIREVFEEAGVFIGRNGDGSGFNAREVARLTIARDDLLHGASLLSVLQSHALLLAPELLVYSARFVTPAGQPRRFDTRFFATVAHSLQEASMHDAEATDGGWFRPRDVLEQTGTRPMLLLPPTRIMCRKVAAHGSAAEAVAALGESPIDASEITIESVVRWAMDDHLAETGSPQ
ncbi:MAG: hypothetical protein E6J45_00995 [Chloroflexi bacterium]|nr:MAG: hypothetical protein E6J45_00995 [Chloroflexota bacterium]